MVLFHNGQVYETLVSGIRVALMNSYLLLLKGLIEQATAVLIPITSIKMPW